MKTEFIFPFYAKASFILLGLVAFFGILYLAQDIIVPLVYSGLFAILLNPIVNFFVSKKINRFLAISFTLALAIIFVASIIIFISSQFILFSDSFPAMMDKFHDLFDQSVAWFSDYFNISIRKINAWLREKSSEIIKGDASTIGDTIINTGSTIIIFLLIPVYVFLILFYKSHLLEFIERILNSTNKSKVTEIISTTKNVMQRYLYGLLLEALIVGIMQAVSLLILGVEYAILFGLMGAFLNMIPYIGSFIAVTLPMIVAFTTSTPTVALLVLGSYLIIQFIDNNIIIPKIVASKVKINALVSIVAVIVGNALWGIAGMFLAIPLIAIVKVIFDHVEALEPLGFLLGNKPSGKSKLSIVKHEKSND